MTATLGLLGAGTSSCASRSTEAFCDAYFEEKEQYLDKYNQAAENLRNTDDPMAGVFGGIAMTSAALGDVAAMFDRLEKRAPEDIQPDVAAIRDSLKTQIEGAGDIASDPLGGLVGGLVMGLASSGSWDRVGEYVADNCGEGAT